jgi:type IV pilus assembly protein PilQ
MPFANAQFNGLNTPPSGNAAPNSVIPPLPANGLNGSNQSATNNSITVVPAAAAATVNEGPASSTSSALTEAMNAGLAGSSSGEQGDLISLEYRNAPLLEVIRTLADAANLNITLSADVEKGSPVSIRLTKVTYEQALRAILDTYKFGAVLENGILKIDTIANLTAAREEKLKEKEAFWKSQPSKRLVWQVNYAKATDLSELLKSMLKAYTVDPRFSIIADKRTNKLIVEGIADALVEAKSILENLDRRKQQVLIEARIVEASSELSKTLSVTWGTRFGFEGNRGMANGLLFPNSIVGSVGGAGALGTSAPNPMAGRQATQLGTMQFTVGSINNLINIDAILRAYETEALANVIASPRVVVQDQERATIKEDITLSRPVLSADGKPEGRNTVANLELVVAPQITSDNTLELDIQVQRQTPTNAPSDPVQGSIKRQANTKLIVANGETAVIGGLYQTQKFKGQGRIPFLGRLPIIGVLFRTNEEQSFRSELMVLITPRILPGGGGGVRTSSRADFPIGTPANGNSGNNFNNGSNNSLMNNTGGSGGGLNTTAPGPTGAAPSALSTNAAKPGVGANNFGSPNNFGANTPGNTGGSNGTANGSGVGNEFANEDLGASENGGSNTGNGNLNDLNSNNSLQNGGGGGNGNFNNLGANNGGGNGNLNDLNGGDL